MSHLIVLLSAAGVAGGLCAVVVGAGRAAAARAGSRDLLAVALHGGTATMRASGPARTLLARGARAATPSWWMERLRHRVRLAGLGAPDLELLLMAKAVLALSGFVLPLMIPSVWWSVTLAVAGFVAPDVWLLRRAAIRQDAIRRSLPEALDLMAIAVTAGTGLEGSIALVAARLPGPLGDELGRMLREVQLGASRREALHTLRERTDVSELSTFALALAQADQLGSPLADVLRAHAAEMRALRRQRARERAAKTPVKLLLPLLLGIFPALGVVVAGPAVIAIARAFGP